MRDKRFALGAILSGMKSHQLTERLTLRLSKRLAERLAQAALQLDQDESAYVRELLRRELLSSQGDAAPTRGTP